QGIRAHRRWLNTDNIERDGAKLPASFHHRGFPPSIAGRRADMTNQWKTAFQRESRIKERMALQLRFDAINLQTRSQFDGPTVNPTSTNFGKVISQTAALTRLVQIHARLRW